MFQKVSFFLGSNSPSGFFSLYDGFCNAGSGDTLYIIKGGPGCGKSSFMHRIAEGISKECTAVEYIQCSGDPDSLDGIYFPELKLGYVDGTAPHIIEPKCPGAADRYLNLGIYYDSMQLDARRGDILSVTASYRNFYTKAYSLISAMHSVHMGLFPSFMTPDIEQRITARANGLISREFHTSAHGEGRIKKRFLDALTCKGFLTLYETVDALAERTVVIDNNLGFAPAFLERILAAAIQRRYDVLVCPDPVSPKTIKHIIVPELSLAFVSQTASQRFPKNTYRHLRLDTFSHQEKEPLSRIEVKKCAKICSSLESEAIAMLSRAKTLHDELEAIYNPYVDFDGVYSLADAHISQYTQMLPR